MMISMRKYGVFWMVFLFSLALNSSFAQTTIENYQFFLATGNSAGRELLIFRRFDQTGKHMYLAADLNTLETVLLPAKDVKSTERTWAEIRTSLAGKPYIKALIYAENQSFKIQDAGITHGYPAERGVTLTIDLCPSTKPLDRTIFNSLISEFSKIEQPVPIALSLSGRFLLTHADDIQWLKELQAKGEIAITWINHSYTHYYNPKVPLAENFLLKPGTDLNREVLGTEIAMLQQGLLPSIFFRFPGLVSDNSIVEKIVQFGLIPVGSDAWLAKGQAVSAGSIVLIHGNGNEPIGVADFIHLLQTEKEQVLNKQWLLYDLRESVGEEFEN